MYENVSVIANRYADLFGSYSRVLTTAIMLSAAVFHGWQLYTGRIQNAARTGNPLGISDSDCGCYRNC